MYKLDLEKEEEPRGTDNIHWIIEKAREFQKNIYFCFIDYAKAFEWKIARRIINNLRYADDTTLLEESKEELKIPSEIGQISHRVSILQSLRLEQVAKCPDIGEYERTWHGT